MLFALIHRIPVFTIEHSDHLHLKLGYTCYSVGQTVLTTGGYIYCESKNLLTQQISDYIINDLIPAAVEIFESTLKGNNLSINYNFKVIPVTGNLRLPSGLTDCFPSDLPMPVPASYRNAGLPDTDVVVFVSARPVGMANVLAFGGECASDVT
jgi:hypothetical protein